MKKVFLLNVRIVFLLILIFVFCMGAQAQTIGPNRVLIRNVLLFDPAGNAEDKVVNILLRNNTLDVVTEDKLSRDDADMVVNAKQGILLGKLVLGEKPSFMVFSDDPRENFEVMMDTFTYSLFVVHDGVVVKNTLFDVVVHEPDEEPEKANWLAYTPPPFMVPLSYQDSSKWNQWEGKWISGIFTSALFLDRMLWQSQDEISMGQVGEVDTYNGGEIRGLRFGVLGTINFENPGFTLFSEQLMRLIRVLNVRNRITSRYLTGGWISRFSEIRS